jgi:menaquinone-dependent protoporphyrinogen oxidase
MIVMTKKILVAYGTAAGSTGEVAEAIAKEMEQLGAQVDVKPDEKIEALEKYDAVVVGTSVRMFRILPKTKKFLRRQRKALQKVPVAYFLVCLTMAEPTPENIQKATSFAKPMVNIKEPVSLGLFGGCMNHEKLSGFFAQSMKSIPEQDHRDWEKIRNWAKEVYGKFYGESN